MIEQCEHKKCQVNTGWSAVQNGPVRWATVSLKVQLPSRAFAGRGGLGTAVKIAENPVYLCQECGARFTRPKRGSSPREAPRYCSSKCSGKARSIVRHHTCEQCGSGFTTKSKRPARFCSLACAGASRTIMKSCQHCGISFRPTSRRSTVKFCSKTCHGASRRGRPETVAHMQAIHPKGAQLRTRRAGSGPHGVTRFGHGCRCDVCTEAMSAMAKRQTERLVRETRPFAHRNGYEWTGPELEIAAREDLTTIEAARMLGRTAFAVAHKRRALKVDPRAINLAGVVSTTTEVNRSQCGDDD